LNIQSAAWWLIVLITLSAALLIRSEYAGVRRGVYLFKPLTTSLIIVLAWQIEPVASERYSALILGGLLFSLAGDIFLMLPADRFVAGLVSFLVAHILYTAAFVSRSDFQFDWLALVIYAVYGAAMLALLWRGLGNLRLPVLVYMTVILVMGWQAMALWRDSPSLPTLCAAAGAALFVISDSALAYDRFRRPLPARPITVLGTYYLAQTLIALSIAA
jgi:uncharacterized membrane protein YhhN